MGFTKEQQLAIDTDGKNIIVSAGAGSGKTAVLTARVIRKLMQGTDIDRLLILTFTNEAANEMKNRIRAAIIKNNLTKQLVLLDSAFITTFDSYALSLVKKYHYLLNIGKNIKIVDSNIITILKYHFLEDIFDEMYGQDDFDKLISDYCLKDDKNMQKFIIDVSNKMDLVSDKETYLNNYIDNYFSIEYFNMIKCDYLNLINKKKDEIIVLSGNLMPYLSDSLSKKVTDWLKPLTDGTKYEDYVLFKTMVAPRFMNLDPEAVSLKEELKNNVSLFKDLLRYNNLDEMLEPIRNNQSNASVIIKLVKLLDRKVNDYKDKYGVYEFNDISHMAIKIVRDYPLIREEIKDFFDEIMVDEYQDTSSLQEDFINYIANDNVYMVGDIKQSIYRFRNANPYIFEAKYNRYAQGDGGIKIDLVKNFRSRSETINNINEIFNLIMDDEIGNANYLKEHNMVYGNTDYDNEDTLVNNSMEVYNYSLDDGETAYEKELFIISRDIKEKIANNYQIFDKETKKLRNIRYDDICIITDRNKYLPTYKKILEYHEIPSVIYMDEPLSSDMVILVLKNLISLVWYVNNDNFDDKFKYVYTSVARSFVGEISDKQIYHDVIKNDFKDNKLINLAYQIDLNKPLASVINDILIRYDIYNKLTCLTDIEKNIMVISNLIDIANSVSDLGYGLEEFIGYLNDVNDMDLTIKYTASKNTGNAVKIMNIHKSKGLEFPICYYTGLANKFTIKEISTKFLIDSRYGIVLPYMVDGSLENTILKDLYVSNYYNEEISEKLRLFYVALTRCREKMIVLANLDDDRVSYNHFVDSFIRLKYRSFLDIISSLKVIDKYINFKDTICNHEYNKISLKNIVSNNKEEKIQKKHIDIKYVKREKEHFSKENHGLIDIDTIKAMDYGTSVHEFLEYADFRNSKNKIVSNLMNYFDKNYVNIYHEYEFIYENDNDSYHGVIDLMLEYDDIIYIVDFKLKNISDDAYKEQLNGYRKYISSVTNKKIKTFLYSIINNEVMEVVYEK